MEETQLAVQLARQAGEILRAGWGRRDLVVEQKGIINPVTEIDKRSEALIAAGLRQAYPTHSIVGEEGTAVNPGAAARWIVDPLDGTANYLRSYPVVAVSIGLEIDGKLVAGVVYNPILEELFVAEAGGGATLNGKPIHASAAAQLSQAVLASGFPYDAWTAEDNNTKTWSAFVRRCASVRCDGSSALDLCCVACGRLDGYWEQGVAAWDTAAGVVIAREAGAQVTDYESGDHFLAKEQVVAANPALIRQVLDILAG